MKGHFTEEAWWSRIVIPKMLLILSLNNASLLVLKTFTTLQLQHLPDYYGLLFISSFFLVVLVFESSETPLPSVVPSFASLEWDAHSHYVSLECQNDVAQQEI